MAGDSIWPSVLVGLIFVLALPLGYGAGSAVCFGMGLASIPGALIWNAGSKRNSRWRWAGVLVSWIGQSYIALAFVALVIALMRFMFGRLPTAQIVRWLFWALAFFIAISPVYLTKSFARAEYEQTAGSQSNLVSLTLSGVTTVAGFVSFALYPDLMRYGWSWIHWFGL